jgi:hypothetical protein
MNTSATAHLTGDQLSDMLIDSASSPECQAHLAHCEQCRRELGIFSASVGDFSSVALGWSEARPAISLRAQAASDRRRAELPPLAWALAAVALLVAGVPIWNHGHDVSPKAGQSAASAAADSPAEIAQDNDLMKSVNLELADNDLSPLSEYRLSRQAAARTRARTESRPESPTEARSQ